MKYALFYGDHYYPSGGWHDFHGYFDDAVEALTKAVLSHCDWAHLVRLESRSYLFDIGEDELRNLRNYVPEEYKKAGQIPPTAKAMFTAKVYEWLK
ncbi:MAG: hypothetical protein GTN93_10520 [Anaerolineae bacterium]|nr:hypothetical protein [Anaerolineae bacterium]